MRDRPYLFPLAFYSPPPHRTGHISIAQWIQKASQAKEEISPGHLVDLGGQSQACRVERHVPYSRGVLLQ